MEARPATPEVGLDGGFLGSQFATKVGIPAAITGGGSSFCEPEKWGKNGRAPVWPRGALDHLPSAGAPGCFGLSTPTFAAR
jgi:hypothetical protein